jgi:hypothetical protein
MQKLPFSFFLSILMAWLAFPLQAADQPKLVNTSIQTVTVFLNGAQVERQGRTNLPAGEHTLKFAGLPSELDPGSVQVRGEGRFTILSVNSEMHYPKTEEVEPPTAEIDKLLAEKQPLEDQLKLEQALLSGLNQAYQKEEALLQQNQQYFQKESGTDLSRLQSALKLYRERQFAYQQEVHTRNLTIREVQMQITAINARVQQLQQQGQAPAPIVTPSREVLVKVKAQAAGTATFTLIYQVKNAGWLPNYDLRVKDVSQPLLLSYKAHVFQSSGEEWKDVKLILSTGDPSQGSLAPMLNPWYLSFFNPLSQRPNRAVQNRVTSTSTQTRPGIYNPNVRVVSGKIFDAQTREPLLGATVVVKGTTVGTVADLEGGFSLSVPPGGSVLQVTYVGYNRQEIAISGNTLNVAMQGEAMMLDEVVISAESDDQVSSLSRVTSGITRQRKVRVKPQTRTIPLIVNPIQKATNVEFEIEDTYSIPTNGRPYLVSLNQYEMDAEYEYFCVPKLDLNAYLTARVSGWEDLNLLEGEANLYFEGTYLGKTLLNVRQVEDTLDISLGRDRNLVVKRTKLTDERKKQFMSGKRMEQRAFEIEVRNQKQQVVRITLEDQFPISKTDEIEVERMEYERAQLEDATGKLSWKLELKPNESDKVGFRYEVKFPKGKSVQLE